MVKVVAADPSSGVSEVVVEQDGAVLGRLRPGDVAFSVNTLVESSSASWVPTARRKEPFRGMPERLTEIAVLVDTAILYSSS